MQPGLSKMKLHSAYVIKVNIRIWNLVICHCCQDLKDSCSEIPGNTLIK